MIKKILTNCAAGAAAASLVAVTGATTVSPAISNVACNYPDSINTVTQVDIKKPVMRRGERNRAFAQVTAAAGKPNGEFQYKLVKVSGKNKVVLRMEKRVGDPTRKFKIPRRLKPATYKAVVKFEGKCRYQNSKDKAFLTVKPKKRR